MKWPAAGGAAWAVAATVAGTAPPAPIHIVVANETGRELQCQALAAHWHTLPATNLSSGETAVFAFSFDPANGETRIPGGALAVERLFCGLPGHAWETRADLDLGGLAASAAAAASATSVATCRTRNSDLMCYEIPQ